MGKEAAAQIGCSRDLHFGAMRTPEADREAFAVGQCDVAMGREEARRRAADGVKVPFFCRGTVLDYDTWRFETQRMLLVEANKRKMLGEIEEELGQNQSGFCVRSRYPAIWDALRAFVDCRPRLNRAGSRAPPDPEHRPLASPLPLRNPSTHAAPVQRNAGSSCRFGLWRTCAKIALRADCAD